MLDKKSKKLYRIKNCSKAYKKKLKRINKTRERLNTVNYIQEVFNDLADYYFDNLTYGDPLRDMFGQQITSRHDLQHSEWITDAYYQDYYMFEYPNWLEYLDQTWTLEEFNRNIK
jgi:hypothetical protein